MFQLAEETEADSWEVEALYDLCFAPGRELLSSYRLREGVPPVKGLCLLLRDQHGILVAAIRHWPVRVGGHPVLLLGPVAVHPTRQGEGLGGFLIRESLARARALGWTRVLLVGDEPYYRRFGFTRRADVVMPPPTNPDRVLGYALVDGAWDGVAGEVTKAPPGEAPAPAARPQGPAAAPEPPAAPAAGAPPAAAPEPAAAASPADPPGSDATGGAALTDAPGSDRAATGDPGSASPATGVRGGDPAAARSARPGARPAAGGAAG